MYAGIGGGKRAIGSLRFSSREDMVTDVCVDGGRPVGRRGLGTLKLADSYLSCWRRGRGEPVNVDPFWPGESGQVRYSLDGPLRERRAGPHEPFRPA